MSNLCQHRDDGRGVCIDCGAFLPTAEGAHWRSERAATWFELARDLVPGSRVKFVTSWDIYPECVVPAGTLGTVKDTGLNEIWGGLLVLPDDADLRNALASWNGEIQLGYNEGLDPGVADASSDPAWQQPSPLVVVEAEPRTWGVWCEVWGGVTGSRAAWLKSDGALRMMTRAEAIAEAERLQSSIASNPNRIAEFSYTARPLGANDR